MIQGFILALDTDQCFDATEEICWIDRFSHKIIRAGTKYTGKISCFIFTWFYRQEQHWQCQIVEFELIAYALNQVDSVHLTRQHYIRNQ